MFFILLLCIRQTAFSTKYYVSPTGSDNNAGTITSPYLTINKAWSYVVAGDTIYVRGGTYSYNDMQYLHDKSGTTTNFIKVYAYPGESPVLTPSATYNSYLGTFYHYAGMFVQNCNYLHIRGLELTGYIDLSNTITQYWSFWGQNVNHCKFESLKTHHNSLGIFLNGSVDDNTILNCDSHHNSDPNHNYENGDGIGIHSSLVTSSNYIIGCRTWWNSDDGYDCLGNEGYVKYSNCWSWYNGYRPGLTVNDPDLLTTGGNGQGFKLGSLAGDYNTEIKRTVVGCLSYHNRSCGFDQNLAKCRIELYDNIAYQNAVRGFNFKHWAGVSGQTDLHINHIARNNISYGNPYMALFSQESTIDHNSFIQSAYECIPNPAITLNDADFQSVLANGIDGPRQSSGDLPVIAFLHLVSGSDMIDAGVNIGVPFNGAAPDLGAFEYSPGAGSTNQAPQIQNQLFQLYENSGINTVVGTVIATDPDAGQSLTYSLVSGNTNNAFSINSTTGVITVINGAALNYEVIPAFSLVVNVLDNGIPAMASQATITISLININEPPVIANQSFSIAENSVNGVLVGNVAASDPDAGQILTYSILSGNTNTAFAINAANGALTVANSLALNYEVTPTFSLVVKVQDNAYSSLSTQGTITVSLTNVNEPPVIANQTFSVVSASANGTQVGTVVASDPDGGQALTYSILSGNTNTAFSINSTTGLLSVNNSTAVNNLTTPVFSLTVRAADNGTGNLYSDATITINVTAATNHAPVISNQSFTLNENSSNSTVVGTVIASDPDAGQSITYALVSGNINGAFAINATSGVLSVLNSTAINFELIQNFNLTIKVIDNGSPVMYSQAIVTVSIINLNEPPVIANQSFTVAENSVNGTSVGSVVASDPDAGQSLTYAILSGNTNGAFAINSVSGLVTVANSTALNYEALLTVSLIVKVQDNGTGTLYSQATVNVNLTDVNEPPVILAQTFSVLSGAASGTQVGTVVASDPDAGQTITYSIVSGNTNSAFTINSTTGVLSVANSAAVNSQTNPAFNLSVRVTDNGSGSLYSSANCVVNVLAANNAPIISNQNFSINENTQNGTSVGTVVATDPNAGQTLTYSILSGNTNSAFALNSSTGLLTVANSLALNYESQLSFALVVKVQDNGSISLSSQATITVNLINVNEAPLISNQNFNINENSVNGSVVGTVTASDPDAGQSLTYSIVSGNTNGAFTINTTTGVLSVANTTTLNYEALTSVSLTIKVSDNGSTPLSNQAIVIVNILNVNEPPVITNQVFTIAENSPNGNTVGTVAATEPDLGQLLTYSIISGNTNSAFSINSSNGVLTVSNTSALNFEATPTFSLVVKVQDNGTGTLFSQATVTVSLTNVNEPPVVAYQSFSLVENSPNGTTVGTIQASDPDAGQVMSYILVSGNINGAFAVNSATGVITVVNYAALNFELIPAFSLTVKVYDNGSPNLISQAVMSITVININEPPVIANQSFSITENSINGTSVGTVAASDPDAGQALTYSILSGNSSGAFALSSTSGILTVANSSVLNFETTPLFPLVVKVQDNGTGTLSSQATINVQLTDINEPPVINNQAFSIVSGAANGTQVGTVTASDPDAGQSLNYSITAGNTGNAFSIGSTTGIITVSASTAVNYQTQPVFSLTVKVTDNGTTSLNSSATVTINVTPGTNHAPVIANQAFSVSENSTNGTSVGTVVASDPDAGQALTYSIVSGNTNGAFNINSSNGLLTVANSIALNFEATPVFSLVVKVQDNASSPLNSQATITVNLINLNEPPVISNQIFNINENTPNGTVIGTVIASDPDAGQTLTYSILSGNTGGAFSINSSTGIITVNNSTTLNYEAYLSIVLTVKVQDNGTGNMTNQALITFNLININEAPVISDQSFSINDNSPNGTVVGTIVATDPDAGQTLTYSILSGNTNNVFSINATTGVLTLVNVAALNYITTPAYTLVVRVTDNYSPTMGSQANVSISVKHVANDNNGGNNTSLSGGMNLQKSSDTGLNTGLITNITEPSSSGLGISSSIPQDPSVYPNPSTGILTVDLKDPKPNDVKLTIYDESGKVMKSQIYNQVTRIPLDLSTFAKGCYVMQVSYSKQQFSKKLILE